MSRSRPKGVARSPQLAARQGAEREAGGGGDDVWCYAVVCAVEDPAARCSAVLCAVGDPVALVGLASCR